MTESRKILELATVGDAVARNVLADLSREAHVEVALSVGEEAVLFMLRPAPPPRPPVQEGGDPGLLGEEEAPYRGRGRGQSVYLVPGPRPLSPDIIPSQWAPPPPPAPGEPGGGLVGSPVNAIRFRPSEADDEVET